MTMSNSVFVRRIIDRILKRIFPLLNGFSLLDFLFSRLCRLLVLLRWGWLELDAGSALYSRNMCSASVI